MQRNRNEEINLRELWFFPCGQSQEKPKGRGNLQPALEFHAMDYVPPEALVGKQGETGVALYVPSLPANR
jgi:hypothetical protein